MKVREKQGSASLIAIIIFVALIIGLVMTNRWLQEETGEITSQPTDTPTIVQVSPPPKKKAPKIKRTGEVIRKTRFSPDRKYEINVFYQEGVEIARNRSSRGDVYDQKGEIPDGKVQFINESNKTYGVECYREQKLHGPAEIYYSDDVLNKELHYQHGKLITGTEYYHDGTVRMKEDYTDARENMDDTEVGIGKVYFRDGTIKYEWHLTVTEPVGFKKSYSRKGVVVDAVYYDEFGQIVDPEETAPVVGASQGTGAPVNNNILLSSDAPPVVEKPPKQIFIPAD